jgi:hypothetical protein
MPSHSSEPQLERPVRPPRGRCRGRDASKKGHELSKKPKLQKKIPPRRRAPGCTCSVGRVASASAVAVAACAATQRHARLRVVNGSVSQVSCLRHILAAAVLAIFVTICHNNLWWLCCNNISNIRISSISNIRIRLARIAFTNLNLPT